MTIIQEFYKIVEGATSYYITSGDTPIVYAGNTYVPNAVKRNEVESKNELSKANLEITFGIDNTIAKRYLNAIIDSVVSLTVYSQTDGGTPSVVWKGRLTAVKPDISTVVLVFESIFTSMRRPGIPRRFQLNCTYTLYGRGCNLDKNTFAVSGSATAVSSDGATITVAAAASQPDGWYFGGMIEAPDLTLRFIVNHVGNQLTLIRPIQSLVTAIGIGPASVRIFPGCDRSSNTCLTKFNNLNNNGSFEYIPTRNPFTGSSFT